MKWNVNDIVKFLNIYQHYPVFWNISDKDYCKTTSKNEIYQRLFSELDENKLIRGMDMKQLKAKIKAIKDVYRQELNKIEKSKESGYGTEEVYSPKLAWFEDAVYLAEGITTRGRKSNLDLAQNSQQSVANGDSESCAEFLESVDKKCPYIMFKNKLPAKMRPPATPMKRAKKQAIEISTSELSAAVDRLNKIAENVTEEIPYDQFGKYVASELRQLPQRHAVLIQQEIQNSIISAKLASLEHVVVTGTFSSSSNQSKQKCHLLRQH